LAGCAQELVDKQPQMPPDTAWHFIGHLQSNKCNSLVKGVPSLHCVETVGSAKLADALERACVNAAREAPLGVYVQVNTSGEAQKSGAAPGEATADLCAHVKDSCPHLALRGVMTIGKSADAACFAALVEARAAAAARVGVDAASLALSMGMSADYKMAIDHGATSVRVGSQIFGARPVKEAAEAAPAPPPARAPEFGPSFAHNVMFLCNHNSCRSQMAHGWLKTLGAGRVGIASAGIVGGTAVKPGAITVMGEAGVDIAAFSSDAMADFSAAAFDVVVSCCGCGDKLNGAGDIAWKQRPVFQDWNLPDPPAIDPGDLSEYRRVRDMVKEKVAGLVEVLCDEA
jgi:glutathione/glutaredoxin type arsenate reductase